VFLEYLHLMIDRGFPIEYFIEGGRSRSGRMLTPKAGILAMTVQSFVRSHSRPLVFVPVYIGYEKLMEGKSYIAELHGRPKKSESLFGLVARGTPAAAQLRPGRMSISARRWPWPEFLDRHHPAWREEAFDTRRRGCAAPSMRRRRNWRAASMPMRWSIR
jgi:glycerol-3-phosphate O-acyltransferase